MQHSDFVSGLSSNIEASRVRSAGRGDAVGCVEARACVRVVSAEEVCALLRSRPFSEHPKPAVVVRGGATMLEVGNPPRRLDIIVETASMAKISEYRPEDMTVSVQAGATLADVNRTLAVHHQRIVLDADDPSRATIGGLLACDRPGAFGYGFGSARDHVLGLELVDGRGRKLRFGGRVVKNVAGYDVAKLFLGSYGTLGIITEATLRTHPLPEQSETIEFRFHSLESAKCFRSSVFASPIQPVTFDVSARSTDQSSDGLQWRFRMLLEGASEELEAERECFVSLARKATTGPSDIHHVVETRAAESGAASPITATKTECVLRMGCGRFDPLDCCNRVIMDFARPAADKDETPPSIIAHLGSGTVVVRSVSVDDDRLCERLHRLRQYAESAGGYLMVESAPAAVARDLGCWGTPPGGFALMRKVKQVYDPDHVLAPGRFVGGI